jgi:hypothetical protein
MFNQGKWTLAGAALGALTTLIALYWFSFTDYQGLSMRILDVAGTIGFRVLSSWDFGCFPTDANTTALNAVLTVSGGLQWGAIGFLADVLLARRIRSTRP